ncbi:hypothetical protein HAX54_043537 [Datura stramonium]|uniref:Uncharacterized protein n=1 Tax=Datura stramonium TaxID=4076 RepID=A0ABS8W4M6_DATST|nr:hypothetical protein [Datura stramonium]
MPCLSSVLVRGKEVDITPKVINSIYWVDQIHHGMGFIRRMAVKNDQYARVTGIIVEGQPLWVVMNGDIHHQDLKFEARMWFNLGPVSLCSGPWTKRDEQRESLIWTQRGSGRFEDGTRKEKENDLSIEIDLNIPTVVPTSPIVDRRPSDDCWVEENLSGGAAAEEIHYSSNISMG